ncbi:hydantoinase B/oxoprolinase family protein [Alloacidobacterium sp.]|uniref:hydantoinase B/oxoprolinase family protein n=1 Tax=Alloacidobacterium sp. TaxID=2951999 RepID=UPI002D541767|nr:hydantoinase B/oxoprolinase family protein [Alloacidobacterium sp.]HYK35106.1 hydantoinase B/oxoprolinase family protein [Alloacidobacterium sp.]
MTAISPIDVSLFQSATHSIAEEMGAALRRTAYSPNIKERRDYSCAIFDGLGQVIAMGDHMPVHLGSMPMSVKAAVDALSLERGDIAMLNDPYRGGTHLPDITMVMPVFGEEASQPIFYVAARAHHADVGGRYPGSMGLCREIYQEGLRIPPVKIVCGGTIDRSMLEILLSNVRTPLERDGDLQAQIGACRVGELRLGEVMNKYSPEMIRRLTQELFDYSEQLTRAEIARMPAGEFEAEDFLDDDGNGSGPVGIRVKLTINPAAANVTVDFSGTDAQVKSSINAVLAVTYSAVYYVFRCLLPSHAPATAGLMRPITLIAPEGTVVNARVPAPVAGGNVETSQRIVDVLLRALSKIAPSRVPAASSGTMSNLTIGGIDPRYGRPFAYYETTAGGMGARPDRDGVSGVHTHMTNSLNTPVEALEYAYPFRVVRYGYRRGSGGKGRFTGGDGLIREIELLTDAQVTVLADRQRMGPYGLNGGADGTPGNVSILHEGKREQLSGKCSIRAARGDVVRVETPGGGGWGKS